MSPTLPRRSGGSPIRRDLRAFSPEWSDEPSYPWSWAVWGWRQLAARRGWSPLALPSLRYDPQVARPWASGEAASAPRCA